jgi:hypothetical protein
LTPKLRQAGGVAEAADHATAHGGIVRRGITTAEQLGDGGNIDLGHEGPP